MSTFTITEVPNKPKKIEEDADAILLQAVKRYRELQAQQIYLANEMKAPRAIIEAACNAAKDGCVITPQFKIALTPTERENFNKKAAIEALGRETLAPFLSTTLFFQLRVS